jgi:hypothetical protein
MGECMPYTSSSGSKNIKVMGISLSLTASKSWGVPGDQIVFIATLTGDGVPLSGEYVEFAISNGRWVVIGGANTDDLGKARLTWTIPWTADTLKLPCNKWNIQAKHWVSGTLSNAVSVAVAYPTRLTVMTDKDSYPPGATITATALLEYNDTGTYKPLAGKTVSISFAGTSTTATTGTDGKATVTFKAPTTPGTYTVSASYAGEGIPTALGTATVVVGTYSIPEVVPFVLLILAEMLPVVVPVVVEEGKKRGWWK